jgi:hypothetical protein
MNAFRWINRFAVKTASEDLLYWVIFRVRPERLQLQVPPSTSQPSRQGLVRF